MRANSSWPPGRMPNHSVREPGAHLTLVEASSRPRLLGENNSKSGLEEGSGGWKISTEKLLERERRSTNWPGKQAVWINRLIPTLKNGNVGMSILAALACLSRKSSGEQSPPQSSATFRGEALHEMAGETGGLDKSAHTRIEERQCGYEHFSSPGLTVEKYFGRTKPTSIISDFPGRGAPRNGRGNRRFG